LPLERAECQGARVDESRKFNSQAMCNAGLERAGESLAWISRKGYEMDRSLNGLRQHS
jgi:hypothetical protein